MIRFFKLFHSLIIYTIRIIDFIINLNILDTDK